MAVSMSMHQYRSPWDFGKTISSAIENERNRQMERDLAEKADALRREENEENKRRWQETWDLGIEGREKESERNKLLSDAFMNRFEAKVKLGEHEEEQAKNMQEFVDEDLSGRLVTIGESYKDEHPYLSQTPIGPMHAIWENWDLLTGATDTAPQRFLDIGVTEAPPDELSEQTSLRTLFDLMQESGQSITPEMIPYLLEGYDYRDPQSNIDDLLIYLKGLEQGQ